MNPKNIDTFNEKVVFEVRNNKRIMKEFSIESLSTKPIKNIFSVSSKVAPELSKNFCSLIFNENTEIKVPILVAASQSTSVTKCIEADPTKRKFSFNVTMRNDNDNMLKSFKSLLEDNIPIQLNEEEDFINLATIGLSIGNDELISPLSERLKSESSSMSCDNVVSIINMKLTFGADQMGGLELETSFIATNFNEMREREDFIEFAKDVQHSQIIEQIIRSDKLKIDEEDVLLSLYVVFIFLIFGRVLHFLKEEAELHVEGSPGLLQPVVVVELLAGDVGTFESHAIPASAHDIAH